MTDLTRKRPRGLLTEEVIKGTYCGFCHFRLLVVSFSLIPHFGPLGLFTPVSCFALSSNIKPCFTVIILDQMLTRKIIENETKVKISHLTVPHYAR